MHQKNLIVWKNIFQWQAKAKTIDKTMLPYCIKDIKNTDSNNSKVVITKKKE